MIGIGKNDVQISPRFYLLYKDLVTLLKIPVRRHARKFTPSGTPYIIIGMHGAVSVSFSMIHGDICSFCKLLSPYESST